LNAVWFTCCIQLLMWRDCEEVNILEQQTQVHKIWSVFERLLCVSNNIICQNLYVAVGYTHREVSASVTSCVILFSSSGCLRCAHSAITYLSNCTHLLVLIQNRRIFCYIWRPVLKNRHDNYSQHRNLTLCFELAHYIATLLADDWKSSQKVIGGSAIHMCKIHLDTWHWLLTVWSKCSSENFHVISILKILVKFKHFFRIWQIQIN
jgi:hypothetical protein